MIDANIPLQVKPIQIDNPLVLASQAAQYQGMQNQNQLSALALGQQQQAADQNTAINQLYQTAVKPDGTVDRNALYTGMAGQGMGSRIPAMQQQFATTDKATTDVAKTQGEISANDFKLKQDKYRTAIQNTASLLSDPNLTYDKVVANAQDAVKTGHIDQQTYDAMLPGLPQDPTALRAHLQQGLMSVLTADQQLQAQAPKIDFKDTGGNLTGIQSNPNLPGYGRVATTIAKTQTPDSVATDNRADSGDVPPNMSKEAISNMASRYNMDGTLPPLGMGKSAGVVRTAVLNEAANQNAGISGDDQRITQFNNKANSAALSKLQQSQVMVGAFEKNFNKNADMALGMSNSVDNTGVPIVNSWINAGKRAVGGDPALASYDIAVKSTLNEYAKIVSGSMGNTAVAEGEIKKAEALLNAAQTPEQVTAAINTMKQETQNRMAGFEEEKAALRASMSTKSGSPTQSAPGVLSVANAADYAKVPSGATYTTPDGKMRRKP